MSNDINDITDALAKQFGGIDLDEDKKAAEAKARQEEEARRRASYSAPREYGGDGRRTSIIGTEDDGFASGRKLFPSERMALGSFSSEVSMPKRKMVTLADYSDEEWDFMLSTPVKRGWNFKTWLEVVGLPTDLHEKYDGAAYAYAARAFMREKDKVHRS